jgi:dimethylaniline monooxygenase (N-oxide forming)
MAYLIRGEPAPRRPEGAIEPDPSLPRACVIGAGSCGIAAAKALYEARVPFDCFEAGPVAGGLWMFRNPNGRSGCYSTLEMNTSGPRMSFSDFPIGDDDYPSHEAVGEYFNRYLDHFGIRDTITFETKVEHVARGGDGGWDVEISGAGAAGGREARSYDAVLVANGHHWDPRWPEPPFPGEFDGLAMHAHDYRGPEQLERKRVVIVGGGNSGVDLARDAADHGAAAYLSLRRGIHVLRKRLGRKRTPIDQTLVPPWLPWPVKQKGFELLRRRSGDVADYGLPQPDHKIGHAHPTVSDEIHDRLASGAVVPKPNIRELRGDRVLFEDGSEEPVDVIVYCTGYKVSFPFFDESFIAAPDNDLPLYRRTFHPEIQDVYFLGLMQPLGAIMPMAEQQAKWIAVLLRGDYLLPPAGEMREDMRREREANAKRFYRSKRHTMEVDFDEWMRDARRELQRGRARAAGSAGPAISREPESAPSPDASSRPQPAGVASSAPRGAVPLDVSRRRSRR